MSQRRRQLALNAFFMRFGHHPAAWRHASQRDSGRPDAAYWIRMAQLAEQGKFDTFFLADFIGRSGDGLAGSSRAGISFQFEPFTLLSAIATQTRHIGLVATVNTNFTHPYNVARQFASLDHISGGRAGWNVVSSFNPSTGKNFGLPTPSREERYGRAAEFLTLSKQLWDSWDDEAFDHPNRQTGQFFDPRHAHPVQHQGDYFHAEGLLDVARPIQGYPVIVQAGNSEQGKEFCAEHAEMTYCSAQSIDVGQAYYRDVKSRMAKFGRDPDELFVTPGLSVVVRESAQEAREIFEELQNAVDFSRGVQLMGLDVSGLPLDEPLPADLTPYLGKSDNGVGRTQQLIELARRENLTIRQLALRFSVAKGHIQVVGSPTEVADTIQEWFEGHAADGFNVVPPLLPSGFEDFVTLVVPELQRRGLFRKEYTGKTYRENLGLRTPGNQHASVLAKDEAIAV
ncbi:LLM class flavin-dependent oxidoreductase [Chitinimonas sp. BJYL2]|uniref:LLM class flavin-dependent oxidoreductase n=1 Tax=Chitinimonas sp. BJYL2 TaxID=2976696 RepID=UPI0022B4BC37|nr:LLM class flavin-dependent oxidoreductase [Chitinimonas sp. BJYL2]